MNRQFSVCCDDLGKSNCGCFNKEELVEVGNGLYMQKSKLEDKYLCFKCREYISELKGETNGKGE